MTDQNEKLYFCNTPEGRHQYYKENKERIKAQQQKKELCSTCGRCVAHGQMTRHMKTKYCKNHAKDDDTLKRLDNETKAINLNGPDVKEKLLEQIDKLQDYVNTLDAHN